MPSGQVQTKTHSPPSHVSDSPQATPHPPQLSESVDVSAQTLPQQAPSQLVDSSHGAGTHAPPSQTSVSGQTIPQVPQWDESDSVSTQTPSQSVHPSGQTHSHASVRICPSGQVTPAHGVGWPRHSPPSQVSPSSHA